MLRRSALSRAVHVLRVVVSDCLDAAFPPSCRACEAPLDSSTPVLCASCERLVEWIDRGCERCGMPVLRPAGDSACGECRGRRLGFDRVFAAGLHAGSLRTLVLAYKYRRDAAARRFLVEALWRTWVNRVAPEIESIAGADADVAVGGAAVGEAPVLTVVPGRFWSTLAAGRDPLGELAGAFAARARLPLRRLLRRARPTLRQTGLPRRQRLRNQVGAFRLRRRLTGGDVKIPEVVVLLDDVVTTCATASAASFALRRAGAKKVYVLSVGRSPA